MVSNEERSKIAKKLREGAEYLDNDIFAEDLEGELANVVCGYGTPSVDVLFNRLAELIEPEPERTCRNTSPMSYKFTCSVCHSSYRFGSEHKVWYCPYCGAKVVEK